MLAMKNKIEAVLRLSSNMIWNSNDQVNIRHRLLLTNKEVSNFPKVFANNLSDNIKLSKT